MIYSDEAIDRLWNQENHDWDKTKGLKLSESDVSVTYTRYINNYKKDAKPNERTIDEAIEARLTPGC